MKVMLPETENSAETMQTRHLLSNLMTISDERTVYKNINIYKFCKNLLLSAGKQQCVTFNVRT
jgi:hypothetical protein